MGHAVIPGSPQIVQGSNFKMKTKTEKEVCFHLSPVRQEMKNPLPCSAAEAERIKGFQKDFYKCTDVSTRVDLEISRSIKPPDL